MDGHGDWAFRDASVECDMEISGKEATAGELQVNLLQMKLLLHRAQG